MGINYQKMGLASPITDVNMGGPYTCNVVVWPLDPQRAEHIGHNSIAVIKALMNYNRARAKNSAQAHKAKSLSSVQAIYFKLAATGCSKKHAPTLERTRSLCD
jgi:hypothetical protein